MTPVSQPRRRSAAGAALSVALVLLMAPFARADVRTEARRHFRRGMQLIADGSLDEGIEELELAYETLPHPNVLYNIGRAYAEAGRYQDALEYFERYLATDPPDREDVIGFIDAIETRIAAAQPAAAEGGEGEAEPTTTTGGPELPVGAAATDDEIAALEESAAQIAQLAEATQSESLRARAARLQELAQQLRDAGEGRAPAPTGGGATAEGGGEPGDEVLPELELGGEREEDIYAEQVVSASRFAQSPLDAPNATTNITQQDIRLSGLTNIGELLRRVPGADVMTLTPSDVSVSFRGFNQRLSPRTLVLIDGRSVYIDPLGATFWGILPFNVEDVERIEVIRGPASALYGADAFSGIVNILTRPPGEPRTRVVLGGGNAGRVHGHVSTSGSEGAFAYRVAAGYNRQDRFTREVSDERVDHEFTFPESRNIGVNTAHLNASARYRLSREVETYLQGGFSSNQQNFQGTGPLRDFLSQGPYSHLMAGLTSSWGSVRFFWNRVNADAGLPAPVLGGDSLRGEFDWNTYDVEAELAREFHFLVDHNLHIGASYRRKQIDWAYLSDEQFENHGAVFFQDTLTILDKLILVASFRTDFHPLLDKPIFSPRGAVVVRPTAGSAIRASVGTAFRTQTFLESYLQLQNPTPLDGVSVLSLGSEPGAQRLGTPRLDPERILSAELGYRNDESDYFDVEVSAYYNRVTDLVILSQIRPFALSDFGAEDSPAGYDEGVASYPIGTIGFINDPSEFDVVGGEIAARIYPVTGLDIYANYALNQAFVTNSTLPNGQTLREDEERTSTHKLNLGIQYRSPFGLDIALDFHWVSAQDWLEQAFDAEEGVRFQNFPLDAYYLLNARVGQRLFDDQLELGLSVFNLTNNKIRQHPFGQRLEARVLGTVAYSF
ncbi:MAG TPA: TonB-dependent receptor [Polyangiaceae bacterium LLY-WYZ-15_(1-7)]|nr:TonB-dependent receptor [Myxococcales bacterium]MAT29022.1 TonB-dependent receptor [Sandaracinus sp.]HJL00164.1 TonB-dependent receptor [Polyangiaceae bacterium LLY-WYZ-15_(1-7)]HJL08912.1 TonB-dependent receptor [Polyangiaceae bacterium LLY-WYZ-15_(1-7)]HJL24845.1 TonB-dependent receptor [Polyangiaceae bacterium LLY-WYZ-15_(1-7)]